MTQALTQTESVHEHYRRTARSRDRVHRTGLLSPHRINHRLRRRLFNSMLRRIGTVDRAVDIGTGTGVWAEALADRAGHVVGIDFVEDNLRIARRNAEEKALADRVEYRLDDAQSLDSLADASFDLAMQVSVLQHLGDQDQALRSIARVLKPGGWLLLLVHNRRCLYNRNLRQAGRRGGIERNEYADRRRLIDRLAQAQLTPRAVRGNWLCVNDVLLAGRSRPLLAPLIPLRLALLAAAGLAQAGLTHLPAADRLFREIVILARKEEPSA